MEEAWKDFMATGKVTDYLRFKGAVSDGGFRAPGRRQENGPDGTEYRSDRDGLECNADRRI